MLGQKSLLLLWAFIQFAVLMLLTPAFSVWVIAVFALLIGYRLLNTLLDKNPVSLLLVNILAALIALGFVLQIKQSGVLHFMLQILLLAGTARLLALRHLFEARQLVWVHYFLIASCFILHQDMLLAMVILALFMVNLYSHHRLFATSGAKLNLRQLSRAAVVVLPLWLAMFLVLPRLPPFWQIPNTKIASTGLSDNLDPGSIEQLVKDDSLAFRVEFANGLPPRQQLYWRARLYEDFNGRSWQVTDGRNNMNRQRISPELNLQSTDKVSYRIIAEASHQTGLFALGTPLSSSSNVFIGASGMLSSAQPVSQRLSYQVSSVLTPVPLFSEREQKLNLALVDSNPATARFAAELRLRFNTTDALVGAIADYFRNQLFYYSLTPPLLGENSVDAFLFDSRTGFCSHYASASALILRHAGIPARVVGGYQGGVWHPNQGYLAVRQREAHAWVEYLHKGAWHRFDPTAAVAPERILSDLDSILAQDERDLLLAGWQQFELLQVLRQQFMHLDYYWSVWVLSFNDNSQRALFHTIKQYLPAIAYGVAILLGVLMLLALLYWFRSRRNKHSHAATRMIYQQLGSLLAVKPVQQPISVFLRQIAQQQPQHAEWLETTTQLYEAAMYNNDIKALQLLQQQLQRHRAQLRRLRSAVQNA